MGMSPSARMFFGFYVCDGDLDFDDEERGDVEDLSNDRVEIERWGYEYCDTIIAVPGTHIYAYGCGPTKVELPKTPCAAVIEKFIQEVADLDLGIDMAKVKPCWILAASYS